MAVITDGVFRDIYKDEIYCFVLATRPMSPNHGVTVCGGLLYETGRGNPSGSVCCFDPQKMNEALLTLNITDWNEVSHHLMKSSI